MRQFKIVLLGLVSVMLLAGCGSNNNRPPAATPGGVGAPGQQPGMQRPPGAQPGMQPGAQPPGGQQGGGQGWDEWAQYCYSYFPEYFEECYYSMYEDYQDDGGYYDEGSDWARSRLAAFGSR